MKRLYLLCIKVFSFNYIFKPLCQSFCKEQKIANNKLKDSKMAICKNWRKCGITDAHERTFNNLSEM